ncbi:MAG TPA: histidine kinase dimerization/phospho-acceptor domain-containing protein, partial [Streptosporangiaceae bacterium]|nr:histidine kinase dimerization/phospho-acceptor domain-containing protein [Streptosporangiaceae bacterium]
MDGIVTGHAMARADGLPADRPPAARGQARPAATGQAGTGPAGTGRAGGGPAAVGPAVTGRAAEPGDIRDSLVAADDLPDGLVVADRRGTVIVFNRAAGRLTGISPAHALGRDVRQVLPLRDRDDRCWWTACKPYDGLSTRTRHPELALYLPDGTELLVSVGYVRTPRGNGPRESWSLEPGSVQRLTICMRSAEQRSRLERSRADLVSTVAHELRSPLTSVKGFTATLLAKWPRFTDDQKRVMLETVNADADRVTRLITELLDVSRIEAGRIEIHRELVDIPSRALKIINGRVAAGDAADRYRIEVAPGLPETWLDADKVDQILANLIENAVRHGAGTVTTVVEPAVVAGAPGVAVAVRDQGPGIAPEVA